jgi:pimeloyl-ACP methyl ester carboxylesterase
MQTATGSVQIDGCSIPYHVLGSGPPVVCSELPLNPIARFARLQEKLSTRYRTYVVDLRPAVGSADAAPEDLLDYLAALFLKTLDALQIDSCVLIGSFMFGGVAMEVARRAPARIEQLVLIGTLGLVRLPRTWLMRGITGFYRLPGIPALSRFRLFRYGVELGDRALLLKFRKRQLFYNSDQITVQTEELYEHYRRPPVDSAGWALLWCIRRLRYHAIVARLDTVQTPTLIVHGTDDLWVPAQYATELQTRLPRARLAWIPKTRHMPELENVDAASEAIRRFLEEPRPAAARVS